MFIDDVSVVPYKGIDVVYSTASTELDKTIFFDYDSYNLRAEFVPYLKQLADSMKKNPRMVLRMSGHADETGLMEYNDKLSELRARTVYQYLIYLGIDKDNMVYRGLGEKKPLRRGQSEEDYRINRRVEIEVLNK
jgi:outer membrane protein OmpA-like peptidoglycan-associated protein